MECITFTGALKREIYYEKIKTEGVIEDGHYRIHAG
jgi:hypothetical protein